MDCAILLVLMINECMCVCVCLLGHVSLASIVSWFASAMMFIFNIGNEQTSGTIIMMLLQQIASIIMMLVDKIFDCFLTCLAWFWLNSQFLSINETEFSGWVHRYSIDLKMVHSYTVVKDSFLVKKRNSLSLLSAHFKCVLRSSVCSGYFSSYVQWTLSTRHFFSLSWFGSISWFSNKRA